MKNSRGFSLLEITIVITIIGLIAVITVVSLSESKRKSKNTSVISQMAEYQKSLELNFASVGSYPNTGSGGTELYCIGDGLAAGEDCMGSLTSTYSSAASAPIENFFRSHMAALPRFNQARGSFSYSSPAYSGCAGSGMSNSSCTTSDYSIWFLLEGTNESCGRAEVANSNLSNTYTLCRLMP